MTKLNRKYSVFERDDGFVLEIIEDDLMFAEAWISHKEYGIKNLMFGVQQCAANECLTMAVFVFDNYTKTYREEYMKEDC